MAITIYFLARKDECRSSGVCTTCLHSEKINRGSECAHCATYRRFPEWAALADERPVPVH